MCLFTKLKSSWVYRAGDDVSVTHFEQLFLHISRTIRLGVHLKRSSGCSTPRQAWLPVMIDIIFMRLEN
jgi:hypothetical protein